MPPYIIYKCQRLYSQWCPNNIIKGVIYNCTKSGWTDDNCFLDYLNKMFIPNTKHLPRPLLLIFDGHYSHLSIKVTRLAMENNIHFLCLPSHSTHLLQPLDIYTLKYVKQQWKQLLWERNKTSSKPIEKREFVQLFSKLYDFALIPRCSMAFAKSGVYSFDPRAIKNYRIIKNNLLTTAIPTAQSIAVSSNVLNSSRSNDEPVARRSTLVRSNSAPNLNIGDYLATCLHTIFVAILGHSTLTTNARAEPNSVHSNDDLLILDSTTSAYKSLDEALNATSSIELTTLSGREQSNSTKVTSSGERIHLSLPNISFNSSSSSGALIDLQRRFDSSVAILNSKTFFSKINFRFC